ncbi:MAG: acid phosphatase type 7 [Thermoleophilaceae bacterium]|nr:acid phosphatase type 7 [Thermoleophilaceae bacterium]
MRGIQSSRAVPAVIAAAALCALATVAPASAATITATPAADSYVASDAPGTNYGTALKLRMDASPVVRSYLRFAVSGTGGSVTRATLRLYNTSSLAAGYSVRSVASNSWGETAITYSNAPAVGATATASSGPVSAGATTDLNVTPLVTGDGSVSVALTTGSSTATAVASREDTAHRPQLILDTGGAPPPPPPGGDPVIAAAGDIACDPASGSFFGGAGTSTACRQRYVSDLLTGGGLARVLTLGDNQYEDATLAKFMQSYDPSWGRVKALTSPSLGNHEYQTSTTAAGYFDYFNGSGAATGPAGSRGSGYYSFDVGTWHLIALNSNCSIVACSAGSAQEQWLKADLAAHPAACTLAYWHHPLFSSGEHGNVTATQPLWAALYAANADIVLNGHDHDYERFAPQTAAGAADPARGIREFVVGTGGRSQRAFGTIKPNSQVRATGDYGVLKLTLRPSSYAWTFSPAAGASFTDSGSANCH